jgi:2-oxoglutarate ferredoxin oxidoreductase subunit beta
MKGLVETLKDAIEFDGFSLLDIWGLCPGRYTRNNRLTPKTIEADLAASRFHRRPLCGQPTRLEYGKAYRRKPNAPCRRRNRCVSKQPAPPETRRQEVVVLGSAGQRIITAGELLCLAGAAAGCHATQKNDYPITVMRGHSVSEMIVSESPVGLYRHRKPIGRHRLGTGRGQAPAGHVCRIVIRTP